MLAKEGAALQARQSECRQGLQGLEILGLHILSQGMREEPHLLAYQEFMLPNAQASSCH